MPQSFTVPSRRIATALAVLFTCTAQPTLASDNCTILYRVKATLEVTDTHLGKGDIAVTDLKGSLVLEYSQDKESNVVDGKVKVLHFAMYESFKVDSLVDVTTALHHFTPTCNGVDEPTWRRITDAGFPSECRYTRNKKAVAIGTLSREGQTIEWAKCKASPNYWTESREAYTPKDKSKGRGCLNDMHVVGNIHCDGRLGCRWGDLLPGDNPQFAIWTQPLIHGPPDSAHSVTISSDLSAIRTPLSRKDGRQSYNLPNEAPSRTWFAWTATRNDASPFTTCR